MSRVDIKYISKRLVSRKSKRAFQEGAQKAMRMNGYVVIVENNWIVKKFSDGKVEKIKPIISQENQKIILD